MVVRPVVVTVTVLDAVGAEFAAPASAPATVNEPAMLVPVTVSLRVTTNVFAAVLETPVIVGATWSAALAGPADNSFVAAELSKISPVPGT